MSSKTRVFLLSALLAGTLACDRIDALKQSVLGGGASVDASAEALSRLESTYEAGRCEEVLTAADELLLEEPDSAEAHYYRGLCLLSQAGEVPRDGSWTELEAQSLEAFSQALSFNPRHALASVGIGDLLRRRVPESRRPPSGADEDSYYARARAAYEKAIAIDPALAPAQLQYGRFLAHVGDLEGADAAFRAAAEAAATIPEIAPDYYLAYGRFLAGPADRIEDAAAQFELAQIFRQDDPEIRQELAILHARRGQRHFERQEYLLAQTALEEAVGMFPDSSIPEAVKAEETLGRLRAIRRR